MSVPIIGAPPSSYEKKIIMTLQEFGKILDEHSNIINAMQRSLILLNQKIEKGGEPNVEPVKECSN